MRLGWILSGALVVALLSCSLRAAQPPLVGEISVSPSDTPLTTESVTFSITASSPAGLPLSYRWNFGDGTSGNTKEPSSTHNYPVAGLYNISVEVSDGVNPAAVQTSFVNAIDPPIETSISGSNIGDVQFNPVNGLSVTVAMSQGGVVELLIDDSNLSVDRPVREVRTDFGDGLSRNALGLNPRHKYESEGIFVAKTTIIERDSGSEIGSIRKTFAISQSDLHADDDAKNSVPADRSIRVGKMKGKFNFLDATKSDLVSANFKVRLPAGMNLSTARDIWLGVGNIVEKVSLDINGKSAGGERYKKVIVKYPKAKDGRKKTVAGQVASVSITMAAADLDDNGFNTDGISPAPLLGNPSIQLAMIINGVSYSGHAEVQFIRTPKNEGGIIKGLAR